MTPSSLRPPPAEIHRVESEEVLIALAEALEQRDSAARGHCDRLAVFGIALGLVLKLRPDELVGIHRGAYLHDIGKVGVPDAILQKPCALTEDEWKVMRTHTARGEAICRPMKSLAPVLPIIRSHHERWDGSGYPDGLKGSEIPRLARVLQLADIFDALTSARPYKDALGVGEALDVMRGETSKGWRDPELMHVFATLPHAAILQTARAHEGHLADVNLTLRSLQALAIAVDR